MKFFQNLSIAVKILIPPAVLVLALVGVSLSALYGLSFQRETLSEINDIALDKITLVDEFIALSEQVQSDVFRISVLRFMDLPEEEIQPIQERMERGLNDLNVIHGQILIEWSLDREEQAIVGRMKEPLDSFQQQAQQAVAVASDNPSFGVILVRAATVPFTEFRSTLTEFLDYQQTKIVHAEAEAAQRATTVSTIILALAGGITLVGMIVTVLISNRLIAQPIRAMTNLMGQLADGDLSVEVGGLERQDEIGGMAKAVEVFRQNALEKAQAEEALRESEEKLRNIVEHSTNAFYAHTTEHVLTYVSPQSKELLGYEPAEAMIHWADLASDHPANLRGLEITQKAIDTGEAQPPYELELKHKQGHLVWVEVREAPVVVDGETVAIVGALTDISERKRAEEAIQQLYEQTRRDAETKTTLLREVNHRVKNNLTSIIGLIQTEQRYAGEKDRDAVESAMERLVNRINGLAQVHDILSQSQWSPVPLGELASHIMYAARDSMPLDHLVSLEVTPSQIRISARQASNLALVINELVTNTLKHASSENRATSIVLCIAMEDDNTVLLEYRDDGPGYPEEVLRLERHGVGLYLIQRLVSHALRGSLTLDNDGGGVTTIRFQVEEQDITLSTGG